MSNREKLLQVAKEYIGKDIRTGVAPRELACVEHFVQIAKQVDTDMPEMYHTSEAKKYLFKAPLWKGTLDLNPGNVILSVTGEGNKKLTGHIGLLIEDGKICSNTSANGKWEQNYTIKSWVKRFRNKGDMPIRVYEMVG